MRIKLSMNALNIYARQTGKTINQIAKDTDLSYSTLNRYARGERVPDIRTLIHICNVLHLPIRNFLVHPDIEVSHVQILQPEEWSDITFRYDLIEAIRLNKQLSKTSIVQQINLAGCCNITRLTYDHLITGRHVAADTILGLITSQEVELDYLFEQPKPCLQEDSVIISRRAFLEMKDHIKKLETAYRELEVKNKRLEKKAFPRYQERMENKDADKIIREFVRKVGRAYSELQSWIEEDSAVFESSSSKSYPEREEKTFIAAEGNEESF